MIEFRTPAVIAAEIRMLRSAHLGSFLILEGRTDRLFLHPFIDHHACRIVIAYGRENAIATLQILNVDHFSGVLAIVDADFDVLARSPPSVPNLLLTDSHDIETMLLESPALDKVLTEFGSESKLATFSDVRATLYEGGRHIGYLRWASLQSGLSLRFEELPFGRFLDMSTLTVDRTRLIRAVRDRSPKPVLAEEEISRLMSTLEDASHDLRHICCGHDLVGLLSEGLRKAWGSRRATDVRQEMIDPLC